MNTKYLLILPMFLTKSVFAVSQQDIDNAIIKAATEVGVPSKILDAICYAESEHNPYGYAFSDGGSVTNHAIGLCQVLYKTAVDYGFKDTRCKEDYRFRKEERIQENCKLFDPYVNALYAAKYLKYQLKRYGNSWINSIAAYNSGSVKICKTGWVYSYRKEDSGEWNKTKLYKCEKGGLLNQRYVDRVLHAFLERNIRNDSGGLAEIQTISDREEKTKALRRHIIELRKSTNNKELASTDR